VTASEPLAALEGLERALRRLHSALEGEAGADEELAGAWLACNRAFERFRERAEASAPLGPEERSRARELVRLHAVAACLASRRREGLAGELATLAQARERLRGLPRSGVAGGCDVRG
jgi:hypothetical protein